MRFTTFLPQLIYKSSHAIEVVWNRLMESYVQYKSVGYCMASNVEFSPRKVFFHGMPRLRFDEGSKVIISGKFICHSGGAGGAAIGGRKYSNVRVCPGACLSIGDCSGITDTSIHCRKKITIGCHVNIGSGSMIMDTDFHSLNWEDRRDGTDVLKAKTAPIEIKDYVFIGANSMILKGVTIGERAIIGAGSVVTCDIPADEVWAGNPARRVR